MGRDREAQGSNSMGTPAKLLTRSKRKEEASGASGPGLPTSKQTYFLGYLLYLVEYIYIYVLGVLD